MSCESEFIARCPNRTKAGDVRGVCGKDVDVGELVKGKDIDQ
jgi:hypothetical protein